MYGGIVVQWWWDGGMMVEGWWRDGGVSHHHSTRDFNRWTALNNSPYSLVEFIGIKYPQKVLFQLLQRQVVSTFCAIFSWFRYDIDCIPCPTSGISRPKDGFRIYIFYPSLNHGFSLLACHITWWFRLGIGSTSATYPQGDLSTYFRRYKL